MSQIAVGQTVTPDVMRQLPPTTRINHGTGETKYVRAWDGKWVEVSNPHRRYHSEQITTGVVEFLPGPVEAKVEEESFAEWERKFVTATTIGARSHGSVHLLSEAFQQIGVSGEPNPGPGFTGTGYPEMLDQAPEGTLVIEQGEGRLWRRDPNNGVYGWVLLVPNYGQTGGYPSGHWKVLRWGVDGSMELEPAENPDADRVRLKETKARAWRVGMMLKRRNSWCETLEAILAQAGVTANDAEGGPMLSVEETNDLPERSVLRWMHAENTDRWAFLVRDNTAQNRARTRCLMGTATARAVRERVQVVWRPDGDAPLEFTLPPGPACDMVALVPVGWQFYVGSSLYRVRDEGQIVQHGAVRDPHRPTTAVGIHDFTPDQFGTRTETLTVVYVPGVSSTDPDVEAEALL